jgi:hypothetical protein
VIQESYATEASEMKAKGVEWVTMVSATSETAKLLRDMKTQGFEPEVVDLGQQYYDPELLAEPGAEGAIVQLNTVPFEEVDDSPALQATPDPTTSRHQGGAHLARRQAFSAGLLFSTAAKSLGNDLTEGCSGSSGIPQVGRWRPPLLATRGEQNPTASCTWRSRGGKFVRLWPEEATTFDCDDSYRYDLEDDFGGGATVKSN